MQLHWAGVLHSKRCTCWPDCPGHGSCSLTSVQQQLCCSSPPDSEGHGSVTTLHHRLQPLQELLWGNESLTSVLLEALWTETNHATTTLLSVQNQGVKRHSIMLYMNTKFCKNNICITSLNDDILERVINLWFTWNWWLNQESQNSNTWCIKTLLKEEKKQILTDI